MFFQPFAYRKVASTGTAIDPDAQAFITAAGLTNSTQIDAVNNLVISLKGNSLWTNMVAFYPIVGGAATPHKYNLKDPQDTNGAYRLTFAGGISHTSMGFWSDAANGSYVDTNAVMSSIWNTGFESGDMAMWFYTNDKAFRGAYDLDMGRFWTGSRDTWVAQNAVAANGNTNPQPFSFKSTTVEITGQPAGGSAGFHMLRSLAGTTNSSVDYFTNERKIVASGLPFIKAGGAFPTGTTGSVLITCDYTTNNGNSSNKRFASAGMYNGRIDDTAALNLYTIVHTYNNALSRGATN